MNEVKEFKSATYKIRSPGISDHAGYFTIVINDEEPMFFFNSKNMDSFQWITSKMTDISRMMKNNVSIEDIIQDMKETFQPGGDYFIEGGERVHSVVHHLGLILEQHMQLLKEEKTNGCY